jgi:FAD/FMN-containing dehydrogenase
MAEAIRASLLAGVRARDAAETPADAGQPAAHDRVVVQPEGTRSTDPGRGTVSGFPFGGSSMVETSARLTTQQLDQLRRSVGEVITPGDDTYDDARRLWNAIHDRRPAVIVRPTTATKVATAVRFAREHDLEIAVQSGGHSAAGLAGRQGGIVIDLSAMRGVEANPETRIARANGGALLGELDVAAQAHGLVCPVGVVGHTGVAGLTLGGGVGRLQRNFGLTIDNLAAVEIATADGRLVRATETEEPELFWGLRGAGWNFGIATAFEFRLQPFGPELNRGVLTFQGSDVQDVWTVFREYASSAPDTVSVIFGIDRAGPDAGYADEMVGKPIAYLAWNHSGSADVVERDTAGLRTGPTPLTTMIGSAPYLDVQTAHDLAFAWGSRSFIKGHYANAVRPDAFDELVEHVATAPGESTFSVTALGGAIGRVAEDATAYSGRETAYDLSADSSWSDASLDEANADWCRRAIAIVEPDRALGAYANGNSDVGPEESRRIYGDEKLARLAALKREWDPDNAFHVNPNVAPATD